MSRPMERTVCILPAWSTAGWPSLLSKIDDVANHNGSCVIVPISPEIIESVKAGGIDYVGQGLNKAHLRGMKYVIEVTYFQTTGSRGYLAAGGDPANLAKGTFKSDIAAQNHFKQDFEWILQHYPTLDGIVLEEWACESCPSSFLTPYFIELKNIINKYHAADLLNETFAWAFNSATNVPSKLDYSFDLSYINDNMLFNTMMIETVLMTKTELINNYNIWKSYLPNLNVMNILYTEFRSNVNQNICDTTKYLLDNHMDVEIFEYHWSINDKPSCGTGTNALAKIGNIWANNTSQPDCNFTWTPNNPIINQSIKIQASDISITSHTWIIDNTQLSTTASSFTTNFGLGIHTIKHNGTNANGTCTTSKTLEVIQLCPQPTCDYTMTIV